MPHPSFASRKTTIDVFVAACVLFIGVVGASSARADDRGGRHVLFTQQDVVQAFDFQTGRGVQIGTATGEIAGTTFVEFQFAPAGPPSGDVLPITFQNTVIITDIDGDQIFFDNDGTGSFHLGVPGADFRGSGGPLAGTYVVTGGTGKFKHVRIGSTFTYRAVATNPPAPPDQLGTVYVEVSQHRGHR
jgi:hypothetical protein